MPTTLERPPEKELVLLAPTQDAWREIDAKVEDVRRRQRMKFVVTGVCLALAVFAAAFLGFSAADILFKLSVGSRIFWMALTLGGLGAALALATVRPWSRLGGKVPTAREVEHSYPQLENQLSTAIEFGRDAQLARNSSSPELVGALIAQTRERSGGLDFARTVNWRRAGLAALLAFLIAGGVALYAGLNPRLFNITWKRFTNPTAAVSAPTLTTIEAVERLEEGKPVAAAGEVPVETSVPLRVTLGGRAPDTVTLLVLTGEHAEAEETPAGAERSAKPRKWDVRLMELGEDGRWHATLRRLLDTVRFKVKAGDAESAEYVLTVFREPQIDEFTVELKYPEYCGKAPETLPPGQGDIKALRGTEAILRFKANTELGAAQLNFESKRTPAPCQLDGRNGEFTFAVDQDDRYQLSISDGKGRPNRSPASYRVKALKDARPSVRIMKPERDLMVHRAQTVKVEISASDDFGVREMGIFHSLGLEETKTMVKRLEPCKARENATLTWDLGKLDLKGGEVIAYYAYVLDNDTIGGPKMAKSEIHFLTIYDEEEYASPQDPQNKNPPTPQSVKTLDKLIEIQKKLLQETFAQARLREAAESQPTDREKSDAGKTAKAQRELQGELKALTDEVKQEMAKLEAEDAPQPKEGDPQQPPLGEKELKFMELASGKMEVAAGKLDEVKAAQAVNPEVEALRNLSETRRLLLSNKEGDPRFKQAMNQQSKKKKNNQRQQQDKDQQAAREEMAQLPPMLEREKELERELEELEDLRNQKPPQGQPVPPEEQKKKEEEQRKLKREAQEKLDKLAQDAKERSENLRELAKRNERMNEPADKMQNAADKLEQAKHDLNQDKPKQAQEKAHEAGRDMQEAQRNVRDALENQLRKELANLQQDAQQLAQKQEQMAQGSREMQRQMEQQDQPKAGDPQQKQDQGQPKAGDPKQGQPQPGDPKQGQPQQGGKPDEKSQKQMASMGGKQQELAEDMKDLAGRIQQTAERAQKHNMPGAESLNEAERMAKESSPGQEVAKKAAEQLKAGKAGEAEHEQRKAAKALDAAARAIQDALQKAEAADMKALADALQKAKALSREQAEINKDLAAKAEPSKLAEREGQVSDAAKELAGAAEKLETLKRNDQAKNAKELLDNAAEQAKSAARALEAKNEDEAKAPAERAEKALAGAVNAMERAAGASLKQKAEEAQRQAKAARENQEKAAAEAKAMPEPKAGEPLKGELARQRDEAANRERAAAREAAKLEKSLEGLQELAKDANPAAAEAAKEAQETSQDAKLPTSMEDLAKDMQRIGAPDQPKDAPAPKPSEAAQKGEKLAETVKKIEQNLKEVIAEAEGRMDEKLKAMEDAAREAAEKAKGLGDPKQPGKPDAEKPGELQKDLARLEPKLKGLEKEAPELKQLKEAQKAVEEARNQSKSADPSAKPSDSDQRKGGPAYMRAKKHIEEVASGLLQRRERLLKDRDVRNFDDGEAPKEYRPLVERYYQALSEDLEGAK